MNPPLSSQADRVWNATLPALRRRRLRRRCTRAACLALPLVIALTLWTTRERTPDQPAHAGHSPQLPATAPAAPAQPSLAVLVVDHSGTRFRELDPNQLADGGLRFDLTLEPVITTWPTEF